MCRAALGPGASPTLSAAGSALAAAFLQQGMAMADAAVLQRLMGLLTTPLAAGMSLGLTAQPYAEWVGVRATVALLEAHALCTLAAEQSEDEAAKGIISRAHEPHRRQALTSASTVLQPCCRSPWPFMQAHAS